MAISGDEVYTKFRENPLSIARVSSDTTNKSACYSKNPWTMANDSLVCGETEENHADGKIIHY
jgi:hypothetical protein